MKSSFVFVRVGLGLALLAALASAQAQEVTSCPAGLEQTRLYAYTGNTPATFTVPARVTSVRLIAVGADGDQTHRGHPRRHGERGGRIAGVGIQAGLLETGRAAGDFLGLGRGQGREQREAEPHTDEHERRLHRTWRPCSITGNAHRG